ncbi:MAG: MFS transporter [Campylobacterota bacterium]|nr:MFS transporter [Campylobacterota bacterium]
MKKINKNIIALGWVSFFTDMSSSMVTTLLPIFVVYVLHEGVDKLGIVIAVATFVSYIFRIVFGYLSDRYKIVKPFVVTGYFISAITKPLLAFSETFISVATLRGTERVGKAVRSASKDSLISSFARDRSHGKTFGFHKMMDIAGELSGALIVFIAFLYFATDESTIRTIFLFTAIPGLLATVIMILFVKDAPKKIKENNNVINKEDYKLFPLLFIYFGFLFFIISEQFFIVYAKEDGFSLSTIPLFIILFTFVQTAVSYYGGLLVDKIGSFKILLLSFIFGLLSLVSIKFNLWLSFALLGLFTVLSLNAVRSYISLNAKSKGFVFGVFYGGVAIFSSLGALVIGYIWQHYGIDNVLKFSIIGMICVMGILILKLHKF